MRPRLELDNIMFSVEIMTNWVNPMSQLTNHLDDVFRGSIELKHGIIFMGNNDLGP